MRILAWLVLAVVLAGCATPASGVPASPASPTAEGVAWSFTATDGNTYSNATPPGNATVLFFMATWCSSCREKAPILARVQADHADDGLHIFSIDFDPTESHAEIAAWQERYDQRWPHGLDTGLKLQRHFQVTSQSTVLVLDAQGEVVKRFGFGSLKEASYRAAIEEALGAPTSA